MSRLDIYKKQASACVHLKFVHEPVLAVGAQDRDGFITAFIEVENVKALYAEYVTAGAMFDQKLKKQAWGDETSSSATPTATVYASSVLPSERIAPPRTGVLARP